MSSRALLDHARVDSSGAQADVAILDEIDSGLDIDALREVSSAVNGLKSKQNATILVTHYKVRSAETLVPTLLRPTQACMPIKVAPFTSA